MANDNNAVENALSQLKNDPAFKADPVFKLNARTRILNQISDLNIKTTTKAAAPSRFSFFTRPAAYIFFSLLGIIFLGAGTVFAAQSTLPGDTLYPLKIKSETVLLATTPSSKWRKDLIVLVIGRRIKEIEKLQKEGKSGLASRATEDLQNTLKNMENSNIISKKDIEKNFPRFEDLLFPENSQNSDQHSSNRSLQNPDRPSQSQQPLPDKSTKEEQSVQIHPPQPQNQQSQDPSNRETKNTNKANNAQQPTHPTPRGR